MELKAILRKNLLESVNAVLSEIRKNPQGQDVSDLVAFLDDFIDQNSLLFTLHEVITEEEAEDLDARISAIRSFEFRSKT